MGNRLASLVVISNMTLDIEVPSTLRGSGIAVVGEAPGEDERTQGEGFVGRAGKVLDYVLEKGGVSREQVDLLNVVKRVPLFGPTSDAFKKEFYKKKQPTEELLAWREMLAGELAAARPDVILACGEEAMVTLTGASHITKVRGSILPCILTGLEDRWVVPIVHPAYILHKARWLEVFVSARIVREKVTQIAKNPSYRYRPYQQHLYPSLDDVRVMTSKAASAGTVSVDLETYGEVISCVGVGYGDEAMCIPIHTPHGSHWQPHEEAEIWRLLRELSGSVPEVVIHNASFDLGRLLEYGIEVAPERVIDTMQAFHVLHAELPKSLEFLTMWYTDIPFYKEERKEASKKQSLDILYSYNCKDCIAPLRVWERLKAELHASPAALAQFQFTQRLLPIALEMQHRGLEVDDTERVYLANTLGRELKKVREALDTEIATDFNPLSPKQVQGYLYDTLKLKVKRKKGRITANEDAIIDAMVANPEQHTLPLILKYRHMSKGLTYTNYPRHHSRKLLYSPLVNSTETYRWAFQSHVDDTGINPQTPPQHLRSQFVPPVGRIFVQPDLSQAEARYVAYYSNNFKLIRIFNDPKYNVHIETGKITLGKTIEKGGLEYDKAKVTRHAFNYGMGPTKLSRETGDSFSEAKQRLLRLHRAEPQVNAWHKDSEKQVRDSGYLANPFAHRRVFYEALSCKGATGKFTGDQTREMYAQLPQSIPPHIVNLAMVELYRHLDIWWHVHTHDGFLASIPVGKQEDLVPVILAALRVPVIIGGQELVTPVDVKVGYSWYWLMPWQGKAVDHFTWQGWMKDEKQRRTDKYGSYDNYVVSHSYGVVLSRYL